MSAAQQRHRPAGRLGAERGGGPVPGQRLGQRSHQPTGPCVEALARPPARGLSLCCTPPSLSACGRCAADRRRGPRGLSEWMTEHSRAWPLMTRVLSFCPLCFWEVFQQGRRGGVQHIDSPLAAADGLPGGRRCTRPRGSGPRRTPSSARAHGRTTQNNTSSAQQPGGRLCCWREVRGRSTDLLA